MLRLDWWLINQRGSFLFPADVDYLESLEKVHRMSHSSTTVINSDLFTNISHLPDRFLDKKRDAMQLLSGYCLLVFILPVAIRAESPSLSFIDLIPTIIANARFVQEKFIDSQPIFNQTWPWIDVPLLATVNGSNCSQDLQVLARDLAARQTWTWKSRAIRWKSSEGRTSFV